MHYITQQDLVGLVTTVSSSEQCKYFQIPATTTVSYANIWEEATGTFNTTVVS